MGTMRELAVAAVCLAAAVLSSWSALGVQLDAHVYDFLLRLRPPKSAPSSAVVVAFDEQTLREHGSMAHLRKPLTLALEAITGAGAKAVAIDIQLADPYDEEWDRRLARALENTPNLVLPASLVESPRLAWEDPRPEFTTKAVLGHVHADPDPDGVSRQVLLAKAGAGRRRWALALEAFRLASGADRILESEDGLEVGAVFLPAPRSEQRALRIRYRPKGAVEHLSVRDLIARPELAAGLSGRVAFLGVTVQGGPDRLMTPYSDGEALPGVAIHAHLYETLARAEFLRSVSNLLVLAFAGALAAAMTLAFRRLAGRRAAAAGFTLLAAAHAAPFLAFTRNRVMPAVLPINTAWLCFLGLGARHYLATRRRLRAAEAQRDRYQQAVHYVTHEMRTPLTAIQGSSELMGRYALSEEKRKEIAGLIHRESRRLARMVEMFLSVERISAGQLELKREAVSAADVLTTCLERARPLAERKQIRLRQVQSGGDERVWGDREFLEYACYNLVTNAIKYSPPDTEISAGVERRGEAVRVSVRDQGYGMDEQEVRRIFERFYRTRRAEQSGEAGTGIGLALVEEIVVQHGGSIEVESRPNQGSRFTLVLPRAADRVSV
jgi:signal transduction histidine kinase